MTGGSILLEAVVVSMDGLLDAREVSVRARVEALREQAARVAAELCGGLSSHSSTSRSRGQPSRWWPRAARHEGRAPQSADVPGRGVPEPSLVPVWRRDLAEAHLPAGYRELWRAVAGAPGPVRAQQLVGALGLEVTAAKVEGLRSKLKRLVARGWIIEPTPGAFAPASTGPASPGGGS